MPRAIPILFMLLMAAAIFPPFIPLAGPISADDLLPLAAVLLGIAAIPFSNRRLSFDATVIGFVLLALIGLLSNAANAHSVSDFLRLSARSTGRIIYYQVLLLGARAILDRGRWPRRALGFIVAAATFEAVFCILSFVTEYRGPYGLGVVEFPDWSVLYGKIRVQGTFSGKVLRYDASAVSANFLAAYLILTIPVTVGLIPSAKLYRWRAALLVCALLQVTTLYLTYTRASLAAFGFAILAMGFLAGRRKLAAAVLIAIVVVSLSIPTVRTKILTEGHDRWSLYWASAAITYDHAAFGVGDGNYDWVLHENQKYHDTPFGIAITTSHNSVLLSAANYGIFGGAAQILLYLLLISVVLREIRSVRDPRHRILVAGLGAGILGYLAQDQLNNLAYVPKVATQMWYLFALLPLVARWRPEEAEETGVAGDARVVRLFPMPALTPKGVDQSQP